MKKRLFAAAFALLALTVINISSANAQSSCPNQVTFGNHDSLAVDNSLQSQIEVTYFTTNDPNVFLSEKAGLRRSSSYTSLSSNQFLAKIEKLQSEGLASIKKRQSATSFLGELAQMNLEKNPADTRMVNASYSTADPGYIYKLDRETEVSVSRGAAFDGDYYRVSLVSWFVDVKGGRKSVDYDSDVLLKPGQTAVFKLMGNDEVGRSGSARSYIAVTLRSVNKVGLASIGRNTKLVASR
ncbi:MAG: hypothetical protein DMF68_11735 [Acidobacteria bacterium]|nr:MAG: hypothetical protein DMF68_11735 [Acidobacteriota bacterium]